MGQITIRLAASAVADLEAIRHWYAEQGVPEVGERLVADIFRRIASLERHPELGRIVPEFEQPFLRELIQPPFRIVYRHDSDTISVVRVWRSERQLELP